MPSFMGDDVEASIPKICDAMVDITAPQLVQVIIDHERDVVYVNVNGACALRCCRIKEVILDCISKPKTHQHVPPVWKWREEPEDATHKAVVNGLLYKKSGYTQNRAFVWNANEKKWRRGSHLNCDLDNEAWFERIKP